MSGRWIFKLAVPLATTAGLAFTSLARGNDIDATIAACKALLITGEKIAKPIAQKTNRRPQTPPPRTERLELKNGSNQVVGALNFLDSDGQILIGSRHLFQGVEPSSVKQSLTEAFKRSGLSASEYIAFELIHKNKRIDAIVFVKRSLVSRFDTASRFEMGFSLESLGIKFNQPSLNDHWVSWQLGLINEDAVRQISSGNILRMTEDGDSIWLTLPVSMPSENHNFTTPGGSGSLIWISPPEFSEKTGWKIGGIVKCITPDSQDVDGLPSYGGVKVISGQVLNQSKLQRINLSKVGAERPESEPNCIPIDRRKGGGW